jgi:hypothetical protein
MTVVLYVNGRYRSSLGSYEAGQELHLDEETAALLLRDSPGTFTVKGEPVVEPEPEPEPDLSAMSTETETGLVVPDRRARGGKKR